ncbi:MULTISPECIES: hypothetical protein [unclassified Priestia]|jgi:hypothetical protein|uniref:hypothetical protein n=1 Tax=unclassified Priestia TaxID=2800374 RepID=UPI0013F425CE|nr:hypothetical protein [Priestia megaterium]
MNASMLKRFLRNLGIFVYIVIAAINIYLTRNDLGDMLTRLLLLTILLPLFFSFVYALGKSHFKRQEELAEQEKKKE